MRREQNGPEPKGDTHRVATRVLVAGGSFATTISALLGVIGLYGLGDTAIFSSLLALCVIAALTMFTAAQLLKGPEPHGERTGKEQGSQRSRRPGS